MCFILLLQFTNFKSDLKFDPYNLHLHIFFLLKQKVTKHIFNEFVEFIIKCFKMESLHVHANIVKTIPRNWMVEHIFTIIKMY